MDMMLLGELVQSSSTDDKYYGFWMPAGGNDGVGAVEVYYLSKADVFRIDLQTKSSDQADGVASTIGGADISAVGITKFDTAQAKDLVRYRISRLAAGSESIHMQFSQPLWSPN